MKLITRCAAVALAVAMCLSLLCITALADVSTDEKTTVALNHTSLTLPAGQTAQLTAAVSDGQEVTWASLTASVVQVDENGLLTALSEGKATVRATTADGSASAICTVTVYMAFPSYSLRAGESVRLSTTISGASWISLDPSVATVDETGAVTGKSFGRTYVVASNGSAQESFTITVGAHVGIDISSWNGTVDWDAVAAQGIEFVMIRAGYGWEHTDANFIQNIEGAIAHNMPIGIYFYSYAESAEKAQVEADYCAKILKPYQQYITLPVAYDLEQYSSLTGTQLAEFSEIFCSTLQDAGYHTMVYANGSFFTKMDLTSLNAMGVDYWYAWYATVPSFSSIPALLGHSEKGAIWQYSSDCVVQGALASGKTDINVLYMPEYLTFTAPVVKAENTGSSGAKITWGGSTYARAYTVYRETGDGDVQTVGTFDGTVHTCTDTAFLPGMGYFVTMEVCDPLDGTYYKSYTSGAVYPESALYEVTVKAGEGGTVTGGGQFIVGKTAAVSAKPAEGYTFDGWYDAAGKKVSSAAEYSFAVTGTVTLTARFTKPVTPTQFTDVPANAWYADAVSYAVSNNLFTGTPEGKFLPFGTMDRSMLATVLYRQAGSPEVSNHNKFVDVSATAWYAKAVTWAYDNGVMNGTGDKTFAPTTPVTREQIATILMRYSKVMGMEVAETTSGDLSSFDDGDAVSGFAVEGMQWAVATQLMNGDNNLLTPKRDASRAECATVLMRWLESVKEQ